MQDPNIYVKRQERKADPDWPLRYGAAVRDARTSKGLSQQKLADFIGVDQGMISNIEKGMVDPTLSTVECLADVLDVPLDGLVGRIRVVASVDVEAASIEDRVARLENILRRLSNALASQ